MGAPPTVLMTADTVGGVFSYAVELSRALLARGAHVVLATMGGRLSDAQRAEVAGIRVHEGDHRLEWMEDPWEDVARAGAWLLDLEAREAPDVVHVNGYAHGALPFRAPVLVVAHSCVLSWYRAVRRQEAPASWDRYRREVVRGLRAAGAVVAPTEAMLGAVIRHYGPLPRPLLCIPNARDPAHFPPGDKEPFVLAAGRVWDEAKNISILGEAAPRLSWPVRVAGSDRSPEGTRRPVPGVEALGVRGSDEMRDLYARASIFAAPARYEPFGLSILEAALSGCALVLGDIPSLRETWEGAACFVDPDDAGGLAAAIEGLARDPRFVGAMAGRARGRALGLTPARMAEAYLGVYRALGARREERPCA